ncbi:MAG: rod shape-determining protein MreC [Acidimicrobiales bacterium]
MATATRRHTSQRLTLVILLLASITVVTLDYRGSAQKGITSVRDGAMDVVSPVQRGLSAALRPVGNFFSGAVNYGSAVDDNARLRHQLGSIRRMALENAEAEHQLELVLSEQHLSFVQNIPVELATVISGSSSNFELTFEIDRGRSSGVGVGMPVVSGAGLVGQIVSAAAGSSVVRVLTDPRSAVGVRFGPKGYIAVANGEGAGDGLQLSYVTSSMSPHVGQRVYTSGLVGADSYPAGIPVGSISSVGSAAGSLTRNVTVQPFASLSNIQYVDVMQWLPPA